MHRLAHPLGSGSRPETVRPRNGTAAALLFLFAGLACEAGPPAFGESNNGESEPSSRVAVDGEVEADSSGVEDGSAAEERSGGTVSGAGGPREADSEAARGGSGGANPSVGDEPSTSAGPSGDGSFNGSEAVARSDVEGSSRSEEPGRRVEEWGTERFPYPDAMRGLYLNAWAAGSSNRVDALIDLAKRTEVNTFVIDIKDASGYVSHRTEVSLAHEIGATEEIRIRDLPGLLERLEEEGIYPVARIVIVKDPLLIEARPDLAVQDTAGGVWVDSSEIIWLNPFDPTVWEYHVDLAREVAEMGFPEIQWDYVRFPDAPRGDLARAVFAGADGRTKAEGIRAFLRHARSELADVGVLSTADVFGVTTSASRDVGIGQVWELFIDVVDAALPMVYPSHYWRGSFGIETPNAYPYEVVYRAVRDAVRRSNAVEGAGVTRPYLQDFSLGEPSYDAAEVRAQIEATYDAGVDEWVLWNPGSRYTEGALEPVGGFEKEPMVRVAGGIHPVSRRRTVIDSVRAAREAEEARARALRDSLEALPDSVSGPRSEPADTAGQAREEVESEVAADTVRASGP
ncbi:MAG: putative glycoside hydrolase [Gemmatimonadota bacterium]|nr:putative glycoside hydrolase [Gemmatimonadota bacterium]